MILINDIIQTVHRSRKVEGSASKFYSDIANSDEPVKQNKSKKPSRRVEEEEEDSGDDEPPEIDLLSFADKPTIVSIASPQVDLLADNTEATTKSSKSRVPRRY